MEPIERTASARPERTRRARHQRGAPPPAPDGSASRSAAASNPGLLAPRGPRHHAGASSVGQRATDRTGHSTRRDGPHAGDRCAEPTQLLRSFRATDADCRLPGSGPFGPTPRPVGNAAPLHSGIGRSAGVDCGFGGFRRQRGRPCRRRNHGPGEGRSGGEAKAAGTAQGRRSRATPQRNERLAAPGEESCRLHRSGAGSAGKASPMTSGIPKLTSPVSCRAGLEPPVDRLGSPGRLSPPFSGRVPWWLGGRPFPAHA